MLFCLQFCSALSFFDRSVFLLKYGDVVYRESQQFVRCVVELYMDLDRQLSREVTRH